MPRWKRFLQPGDQLVEDAHPDDLIVLVMGASGAGKSTFLNSYLGEKHFEVNSGLKSCTQRPTSTIKILPAEHRFWPARRLVLIDTPGFNDTDRPDYEILRLISMSLASLYDRKVNVAGVIYLCNINDNRVHGSASLNFKMFQGICGKDAYPKLVMATSCWSQLGKKYEADGEKREASYRNDFWKEVISKGAHMKRVKDLAKDPFEIVELILETTWKHGGRRKHWEHDSSPNYYLHPQIEPEDNADPLLLQHELVDLNKAISKTKAGMQIRLTSEEYKAMKIWEAQQDVSVNEKGKVARFRRFVSTALRRSW